MATINKKEKEPTAIDIAYKNLGDAISNYFNTLGEEIKKSFDQTVEKGKEAVKASKEKTSKKDTEDEDEHPVAEEAPAEEVSESPSESDGGFTDEEFWGTATPGFILENGLAESEERAIEIAKFLKENPEKKEDPGFLRELFIKAQFKVPAAQRMDSSTVNFPEMAIIIKDDPIQVEVEKETSEATSESDGGDVTTEASGEPDVAHPAVAANPMAAFMKGIPLEAEPAQGQGYYAPQYPQYTQPQYVQIPQQPQVVTLNGSLYQVVMTDQGSVLLPLIPVEGQQVNPTEAQQVSNPHPAGYRIKERIVKEIIDSGATVEGPIPGVDESLIKEAPTKVKITPMVEKSEEVEDPIFSIVKGGHPDISEENGNILLINVLNSIKDAGFTCAFRELKDQALNPVGVYEFHLFNGENELGDLKFIVDLGRLFDKRAKFCVGASNGLESKEWFELQKNQGKDLVYTDEILKNFFQKGRKWIFNQRSMYNGQWRQINKSFVDLASLPEAANKQSRQYLHSIISDLYNCRELMAIIGDIANDPRFRVIEYDFSKGTLILTNLEVKDSILGAVKNDPEISISYGSDGRNIATIKSQGIETQVTIQHNQQNK